MVNVEMITAVAAVAAVIISALTLTQKHATDRRAHERAMATLELERAKLALATNQHDTQVSQWLFEQEAPTREQWATLVAAYSRTDTTARAYLKAVEHLNQSNASKG